MTVIQVKAIWRLAADKLHQSIHTGGIVRLPMSDISEYQIGDGDMKHHKILKTS